MEDSSLKEIFASLNPNAEKVFVVPLIRYSHKQSDYLYLLYEELIEDGKLDIQSISVFNHFKLITGILRNRNAILHYHWLEFQDFKSLLGMPWKMICIYLFHKMGGKLVWTLHNEFPHDQKYLGLHSYLHQKMAKWADVLHVHCETALHKMKNRLDAEEEKFRIVAHPEFPASPIDKETAIQNLNEQYDLRLLPDEPILLMFGNISRYKQIEKAATIVESLETDCKLIVAGPVKKGNLDLFRELKTISENGERLILIPDFIPENKVSWFYSASDICLFNYREILSSGGYHMAQAYQKTIIAPRMGCLKEEANKSNVILFDEESELKSLLTDQLKALRNG